LSGSQLLRRRAERARRAAGSPGKIREESRETAEMNAVARALLQLVPKPVPIQPRRGARSMTDQNEPSILIAFNLEDPENYALDLGLHMAKQWNDARVHVVYVVTTEHLYGYEGKSILSQQESALTSAPEKLRARVADAAKRLFGEGAKPKVSIHVRVGQAAQVILQTAVDYGADLLVVGTHDRRGVEKLMVGSVAQEIVKRSRAAVLVARPTNYQGLEKTPRIDPPNGSAGVGTKRKVHTYSYSDDMGWISPAVVR
jgi:nucleotide-binding universal stress UspA family protein